MRVIMFSVAALLLFFSVSCKEKPGKATGTATDTTRQEARSYLPIADFIGGDITLVDSFAGGILKKTIRNGKKDSVFISLNNFHQLAQQFLLPELDSTVFHRHYQENSLMDETTQMLHFMYSTKDSSLSLRNAIVYIKPSLSTDNVERIYMERELFRGDTLVQEKLTWKMQEYFYTIRIKQPKDGAISTTIEKVIWDPQQFSAE